MESTQVIQCPHIQTCSGCMFADLRPKPPLFHQADGFLKEHSSLPLVLIQGRAVHWRTRAKLCVRKDISGKIVIGLFKKHSHEPMAIPHCQVHHPRINETIEYLVSLLEEKSYSIYNENTHRGDLRYVQLIVERSTSKVQLSLVINSTLNDTSVNAKWENLCHFMVNKRPDLFHSLWINYQPLKTNTIFGKEWNHVVGQELLWERICSIDVPFGPSHFGQANLEMFQTLLDDLKNWTPPNLDIAELYGGVGIIGLSLLENARTVKISEIEPTAHKYFSLAKEKLLKSLQERVSHFTESAEKSHKIVHTADLVIVDPPRKGLTKDLIQEITQSARVRYIAYVSCNWQSFERDYSLIVRSPGWKLAKVRTYLFFPGTNHIETLALFEKESG